MKNKCTSYKTSKALADAGFDSEAHCGWWASNNDNPVYVAPGERIGGMILYLSTTKTYKAFCCHDLLMALHRMSITYISLIGGDYNKEEMWFVERNIPSECKIKRYPMDMQPQEALALCILEVLKNGR